MRKLTKYTFSILLILVLSLSFCAMTTKTFSKNNDLFSSSIDNLSYEINNDINNETLDDIAYNNPIVETIDAKVQEELPLAQQSTETAVDARIVVEEIGTSGEYILTNVESISSNNAKVATNSKIVEIGYAAFRNFKNVEKLDLSDLTNLRKIDARAFLNCKNLAEIILPTSIEEVGEEAFLGTRWLEIQRLSSTSHIVSIQGNVAQKKILVDGKFAEGEVDISGTNYSYIAPQAFANNPKITSARLTNFGNVTQRLFVNCQHLVDVEINNCSSVGEYAFAYCSRLEDVKFNVITSIEEGAFSNCTSLKNLYKIGSNIEDGLMDTSLNRIGENAFSFCTSLKIIKLPDTQLNVGIAAFYGCTSLKSVVFKNTKMNTKTFDQGAFMNCSNLETFENLDKSKTIVNIGAFIGTKYNF